MNRAKKTKQYLKEQLDIFKGYADLRDSKEEFFSRIREFRDTSVLYLRETEIINQDDMDELDSLLANIDTKKSKGFNGKVYWSGVQPEYVKVQSKLYELILRMDRTKVPLSIKRKDFVKDVFSGKSAIFIISSVIILLVVALVTDLGGLLIDYIISLFKSM